MGSHKKIEHTVMITTALGRWVNLFKMIILLKHFQDIIVIGC